MDANDNQIGGTHYQSKFQHWDFVQLLGLDYLPAQITRYMSRWQKKNGTEDLKKALHYIEKLIEVDKRTRRESLVLLDNFIKSNALSENEALVFNMLVNYKLGDDERLRVAEEAVKGVLASETPAAYPAVDVDPVFRENHDEWKVR